jgi:hypothetical protein
MQTAIPRDSKPLQLQVWASFRIAVFLCAVGLSFLPGRDLDRAFMVMGYFFCLSAPFVLAKFVRDQHHSRVAGKLADTPLFKLLVWGGFFVAMSLTGRGLWRTEVNATYKAFLVVSWLYLITCSFTLAKMLRDRHEADSMEAQLGQRTSGNTAAAE